ncbi:MAG: DUF4230 domain-containing protein, partial [Candidatus Angelobacter sp.]
RPGRAARCWIRLAKVSIQTHEAAFKDNAAAYYRPGTSGALPGLLPVSGPTFGLSSCFKRPAATYNSSMTETSMKSAVRPPRLALLPGLLMGAVIALLLAVLMARVQSGPLAAFWSLLSGRNTRITSEGSVIERIQRLQRMETVVFNMDKIVTGEKDNPILPDFIAGDRLLMIVHGQVVAGIDFSRLKREDIKIQGKEVRIHLPNPQILIMRLDNARTKVYSRNTGLLVRVDPNLETQVRQEAEGELLQEAALGGIIINARDNARATVTTLLQGMGFEKVEVD